MIRSPTVVDLFSGPGGLSYGFREAGFTPIFALEKTQCAVRTYARNVGDHVQHGLVGDEVDLPAADVFIGGPPCQGFSSAGARRTDDERNTLVGVYARLIAKYRPKAFLFENVEGFLTADDGQFVLDLLEPVIAAGYRVHLRKVNAANFGVPQHRKRVIAVGGRGWSPSFPSPTHFAYGAPGAARIGRGLPPCPTVAAAIATLGLPSAAPPGDPFDHVAPPLSESDVARITALLPGQKMADLPDDLQHPSYQRRANRRVRDGTPTERRGGAPTGIRRLVGKEPSKAITSAASAEFVHPSAHRFLTLRECARIQTFPDSYVFDGSFTERATMIGDAVPPKFAERLARNLLGDLANAEPDAELGGLLSIALTNADAMSPALQATLDLVSSRFPAPSLFPETDPTCLSRSPSAR